jgi:DNA-binding SARP family transcriptional activator
MSSLSLNLLGSFGAYLDGESIDELRSSRVQALLIYLAVERSTKHRREYLFTLLWPGMPEKSARHNLSQTIYALRQTFTCIQALEQAVGLYRGDFLADFYLEDSNQFEDWATATREAYRRKTLEALQTLTDIAIQKNAYDQASAYAERQLAIDNLNENAHRQMMEVLALAGRRVEALRQYRQCVRILEDELGVAPSSETTALYDRIQAEGLPSTLSEQIEPKPEEPSIPFHNLPSQPNLLSLSIICPPSQRPSSAERLSLPP